MTQTPAQSGDPYDAAMHSQYVPPPTAYFGMAGVGFREIVFEPGQGRVVFDPTRHEHGRQILEITLTLTPVDPARGVVTRELLANGKPWVEIVRPSLTAAGTDLRRLDGAWVEMTLAPDGRTYTDKTTGLPRQSTTLKLVRLFPDEASCLDAYREQQAGRAPDGQTAGAIAPATSTAPPAGSAPSRATAARFLPALWEQAGHDVGKLEELLAANALLSAHFTIGSDEVLAVIGGQDAPVPASGAATPAQP
jgi:hypothetical protein